MLITSAKPIVSMEAATSKLKGRLREFRRGRLIGAVDFYIPYRCFDVRVTNRERMTNCTMAIDSVTGQLDAWRFEAHVKSQDRVLVSTDRIARDCLPEFRALQVIKERVTREVYLKGFFKVRGLEIGATYLETLYIPYWVGIYERNNLVKVDVVNAVSGLLEGVKLREVVTEWFSNTTPEPHFN